MEEEFNLNKKLSREEKKDIVRNKIDKSLERGWQPDWMSAARRAWQEMMPEKKFETYVRVANVIAKERNIELTRERVQLSTNRNGDHSWYIKVPNRAYKSNLTEEEIAKLNDHRSEEYVEFSEIFTDPEVVVKITDHNNSYLQMHDKNGLLVVETYVISFYKDDATVSIVDTIDNYYAEKKWINDDGRDSEDLSISDLENRTFENKDNNANEGL